MIELESMAVAMPLVEAHPNRMDFRGVLTLVDVPSERSPHGARGHRVVLTRAVAEGALASLIGMAVDYTPSFDRHDMRCKVGVITKAEVVGRNLEVGGYLYAKDFPEVIEEIEKFGGKRPGRADFKGQELRRGKGSAEGERLRASLGKAVAALRKLTAGMEKEASTSRKRIVLRAEASEIPGVGGLGMSFEVTDVDVADFEARVWTLNKVVFTGAAILRKSKAAYRDTWIELVR